VGQRRVGGLRGGGRRRLDGEGVVRAGEALRRRLDALDDRHGEHVAADVGVDVEHLARRLDRLLARRVRGVALLRGELGGG